MLVRVNFVFNDLIGKNDIIINFLIVIILKILVCKYKLVLIFIVFKELYFLCFTCEIIVIR